MSTWGRIDVYLQNQSRMDYLSAIAVPANPFIDAVARTDIAAPFILVREVRASSPCPVGEPTDQDCLFRQMKRGTRLSTGSLFCFLPD